jgi:hypothetical protein
MRPTTRLVKGAGRTAVLGAATLGMVIAATGTAQAGVKPSPKPGDARAAAAAAGTIGPLSSWFTGTVAAGASQVWTWNNAASNTAYIVGYNPTGASTTATCQFETTSSRYLQRPGGERQFQFTTKNVGSIACGATILFTSLPASVIGSTGGVDPGETQVHLWTNLPWGWSFLAGLNVSGATSSTPCQFQVTRSWYVQPSGGLREFWMTIKNVGTIACQAEVLLGATSGGSSFTPGHLDPGASRTKTWNNANPVTSAYLIGLSPASASPNQCQQEVTRLVYRQRINTDGSSERELSITVKNVGTAGCGGLILLPTIAA